MKKEKSKVQENINFTSDQYGSFISKNVQNGSVEAMKGMKLFKEIVEEKYNVDFEQKKGNLFEFIEAAKFNRNAANQNKTVRASVTHAMGEPHAPDDIRLVDHGQVVERVQAKVNNMDSSSNRASAVREISNTKYKGMQLDVSKDTKKQYESLMDKRIENGNIYEDDYKDAKGRLSEGLTDKRDGTTSGGTSVEEIKKASDNLDAYALKFEIGQYAREVGVTTVHTAASGAIMSGAFSAVSNFWEVFQDKKELDIALKDITKDTTKGLLRGGGTGFLSSVFRIGGQKAELGLLSDASATTALAGGVIDAGIAIYSYAKGEFSLEQLKESLQDTTVKTVSTVYFTKAIEFAVGKAAGPFLPIAVYTVANYVVTSCREIIKEARLNAAEYDRIASLYNESTKQIIEYRIEMEKHLKLYVSKQNDIFYSFLNNFESSMITGQNYDNAIASINSFTNQFGLELKHANYNDFSKAIKSDEDFVL